MCLHSLSSPLHVAPHLLPHLSTHGQRTLVSALSSAQLFSFSRSMPNLQQW